MYTAIIVLVFIAMYGVGIGATWAFYVDHVAEHADGEEVFYSLTWPIALPAVLTYWYFKKD